MDQQTTEDDVIVPFEQTDRGNYRVVAPTQEMVPDELAITIEKYTYFLSDFQGKDCVSRFQPDVLLYDECSVVVE